MYKIQDALTILIGRRPHVGELLNEGLVNIMELARVLRPELEEECLKEMTVESVAMAIRRLPRTKDTKSLARIFKRAPNITLRSDLVEYTFANSATLIPKKAKLLQRIGQGYDSFFAITQGVYETSCVLSHTSVKDLQELTQGEKVVGTVVDLTAVTIRLPPENVETPGVYYHILRALYHGGVNVIDVVSTNMELTIMVETKDSDIAFGIVKKLFV